MNEYRLNLGQRETQEFVGKGSELPAIQAGNALRAQGAPLAALTTTM
jgi:hypothetical protein